ncbi:hypothetical protein BKA82DRAFT_3996651, partial [Pisolithus tinctorius]
LTVEIDTAQLIQTCYNKYSECCIHRRNVCRHNLIVYTDGASFNNGRYAHPCGWGKRMSQRTELLAALHGLKKVCDEDESYLADRRRKWSSDS